MIPRIWIQLRRSPYGGKARVIGPRKPLKIKVFSHIPLWPMNSDVWRETRIERRLRFFRNQDCRWNQPPFVRPRICRRHARLFPVALHPLPNHATCTIAGTITKQLHPRNLPDPALDGSNLSAHGYIHVVSPFQIPLGFVILSRRPESSFNSR